MILRMAGRYSGLILLNWLLLAPILSAGDSASLLADYRALRDATPDPAASAAVQNVILRSPGATIELSSGVVTLLPKVAGRVPGAIFKGTGVFTLTAPSEIERAQTARYSQGQTTLTEPFTALALYFSGKTGEQLLAQLKPAPADPQPALDVLTEANQFFREGIRQNFTAELLRALRAPDQDLFLALIFGQYRGKLLYARQPYELEDVTLLKPTLHHSFDVWNSFTAPGTAGGKNKFDATEMLLDATIRKDAMLEASAELQFTALAGGSQLVPFNLAPTLRVKTVATEAGEALAFIQEPEKRDSDLWIAAPAPLEQGRQYKWKITYAGKGVVEKGAGGNFFVKQRTHWFPRLVDASEPFADRIRFRMTFRVPKDNTLVATGDLISRKKEGEFEITEWDSKIGFTVAGFNYGSFKSKTRDASGYDVTAYTNTGQNDDLTALSTALERNPRASMNMGITTGGLSTSGMADSTAATALNSLMLYHAIFGDAETKSLAVSQQPAGFFGQSWPTLVFLPYTAFLDPTTRRQLKLPDDQKDFFRMVGPHEVAHQWWGHTVTFPTYHEQWMSEGFAHYSAGLFLERFNGQKQLDEFLQGLQEEMLEDKGVTGQRPVDAGPISLGVRLASEQTPGAYRIVYSKGAFVLHMLRMMLHDFNNNSDPLFVAMMHDFVATYKGRAPSNADFEKIVSKHFGQDMHWFFQQWVDGTAFPHAEIEYSIQPAAPGYKLIVNGRLTAVPPGFRVVMPVTIQLSSGDVTGRLVLTAEGKRGEVPLPEIPAGVTFNPLHSVLCDLNVRKR
jgi:hypothetical protein